ncbi:hypothetical protein RUM44_001395 [Polyplax serrata]|uniref:sulfite oxidase n=1 Tax=Polyplax serrata TaxID=468196 RepID=A0ABR1ALL3_POLSC
MSYANWNRFLNRLLKQSSTCKGTFSAITTKKKNYILYNATAFCSKEWKKKRYQNEGNYKLSVKTLGLLTASAVLYYASKKRIAFTEANETNDEENIVPGKFIDNLPIYVESDVAKHSTKENRIWVTYKNGVYDVTEFVEQHPGGNKILLAAGSSIEPFWALYAVHHTQEVYGMLEQLRIGNIKIDEKKVDDNSLDPYGKDPKRHPVLKPASVKPFNAEPPPSLLVDKFYTPNSIFYVRNHLPVPEINEETYKLEIKGIGMDAKFFTLNDIKKFPKHTISATVQCAGNRRSEMSKVKQVKGLSWDQAAIGNATWSGARLTDVLTACGLDLNHPEIQHVQFEAFDKGPDNVPYGASVPADKALDPKGDVLLAYEMNGEVLPRDHGYPLRVIVPGVVGARNVKWVSKIVLSEKESDSHWQQNDYKGFSPGVDWDSVDFKSAPAIQELPVISAICVPANEENVEPIDGCIMIKGYAWSGGGKRIVRVDVSSDKGKSWHVADLEQTNDNNSRHWSWTLWSILLPVPESNKVEIWAKAVDSAYNTQPESIENIWNLRGVLTNAYHKIQVNLMNNSNE